MKKSNLNVFIYVPGENSFNMLNAELQKHGLDWKYCVALGADNANVMSGRNKGLMGHILQQNPQVHFAGCPCHLIHISAKTAASHLSWAVGDRLIDIYYYFLISCLVVRFYPVLLC